MRRLIYLALLPVIVNCTKAKSATEAAQAYDVQISNGFTERGGVFIASDNVLGDVSLVPSTGEAQLVHAGKTYAAGLVKRQATYGLLLVRSGKFEGATLGDSGKLEPGVMLTMQNAVKLTGWRAHEGRAYMEIDFDPPKNAEGTGVFGPDGRLVGLLAFTLGDKLTYVLPIEYLTSGDGALTQALLGKREASAAFIKRRDEAATHKEALRHPPNWKRLELEQSYSRTALVGRITLLDKQGAEAAHGKALHYKLEAIDQSRARRTIAEGNLPSNEQRWVPLTDRKTAMAAATEAQFGHDYVSANIAPYDVGEWRYRIPFPLFCAKVTENEVHALTLSLTDTRHSDEIPFADMVNICAAIEEGDGDKFEKEWGMNASSASSTTVASSNKDKIKGKKPKGKKKGH